MAVKGKTLDLMVMGAVTVGGVRVTVVGMGWRFYEGSSQRTGSQYLG